TEGVNYIVSDEWADLQVGLEDETMKINTHWDKERYFNLWVVRQIDDGGILGYAYKPESGYDRDGVVVRYGCFGTSAAGGPFVQGRNGGRTATHEIGHWLSLDHPFNDHTGGDNGCRQGHCSQTGDKICDTPPAAAATYGTGTSRKNSCTFDVPDLPDNPRQYMDYLNDAACNYFSPQQAAQMRAVLQIPQLGRRFQLWQDYTHRETGVGPYKAPKANFWASNLQPCPGAPVRFVDYSQNRPDEYFWRFPGAVPETSTDPSPVVVYSAPGVYDVELRVRNRSQIADSIVKRAFIRVQNVVALPLEQNFADAENPAFFPPTGWHVVNPDSAIVEYTRKWDGTRYGHQSPGGARMRFHVYSDYNQEDGLVSPPIALAGADSEAVFRFSYAYAPYQSQIPNYLFTDTLSVQMSLDCGHTWTTIWRKGGADLNTTGGAKMSEWFEPGASEWRRETISLDSAVLKNASTIRFRFWAKNGWGNNLFVDDVYFNALRRQSIEDTAVGRTPNLDDAFVALSVYPNPSASATIRIVSRRLTTATLEIYDAAGRRLLDLNASLRHGETLLPLPADNLPPGLYAIRIAGTTVGVRWIKID
ncbi:MAG: M43 family zinc metalloprotease, partial [Bacteroidia bacterium]|nr:M43 family zinc metalloprotease [Bacteroidia bacterium]